FQVISQTAEDEAPGIDTKYGLSLSPRGHAVWAGNVLGASSEIFLTAPPSPGSIDLDVAEVIGGRLVTGRVTLPEPAPAGGAMVRLSSSDSRAAAVSPSIMVPAGQRTAAFPVTTFPVGTDRTVVITASFGGQKW